MRNNDLILGHSGDITWCLLVISCIQKMMYDAGDINDIWAGIQAGSTLTSLATWTSTGLKDLT